MCFLLEQFDLSVASAAFPDISVQMCGVYTVIRHLGSAQLAVIYIGPLTARQESCWTDNGPIYLEAEC